MEQRSKRRKYVGIGGDDVPSLGVLEGEILRILWEAEGGQSSVQVYDAMYQERKLSGVEMQSPSTVAVTLSRMVEKGLLGIEKRAGSAKGFYVPLKKRADVVVIVLDDVSIRLTGQSIKAVLQDVISGKAGSEETEKIQDVVDALRSLAK